MSEKALHIEDATIEDAEDIARICVDTWRSAYSGFIPQEHLASLSYHADAEGCRNFMRTFDHPHIIKKAVVDGTTVGYLSAGPNLGEPEAYEGEVYDIFVLEEYQKRGIGCRLLAAAADWFREMGYESVLIWCWEQNPSTAFYRRLGGSEVHHTQQTVAGKQLAVTVFGWELKDLEAALRSR